LIAPATVTVALAITATAASAATTRAEWVAQVDPICQNGQAQEAVAGQPLIRAAKRANKNHGSKGKKSAKKLVRIFIRYFQQYAAIEHSVNDRIATIPPAPDDVSLVQVWLRARNELLDIQNQFFTQTLHLKGLKGFNEFFELVIQLAGREQETVDLVRDFGFQYCSTGQSAFAIGGGGTATVSP
jgi:hypothetical protein